MVEVVAILTGKQGTGGAILDAFRDVAADVHAETGCQLYATFAEIGTDRVVVVERWATSEDLAAHSAGEPFARLGAALEPLLASPLEVLKLQAVPLGDPAKGQIPSS